MDKYILLVDISNPDTGIVAKAGDVVTLVDDSEADTNGVMVTNGTAEFYVSAQEVEPVVYVDGDVNNVQYNAGYNYAAGYPD